MTLNPITAATPTANMPKLANGDELLPPLHPGEQGIQAYQTADANKVIKNVLQAPGVGFTATYRQPQGVYDVQSAHGDVQFRRVVDPAGKIEYPIVHVSGTNPIANTDENDYTNLKDQIGAAGGPNKPVPASKTSYPEAYRRISQLFDSTNAPDIAYSLKPGDDPNHPGGGTHGNMDVIQSRAPLIMSGPGIAAGTSDVHAKVVDVAPTIADELGVKKVTGYGPDGELHPNQFLKWQDGTSLLPDIAKAPATTGTAPAADTAQGAATAAGAGTSGSQATTDASAGHVHAQRAIMFVLDGANQAMLYNEIKKGDLPNIARIAKAGTTFKYGHIADFPSVTWPNHNALMSGADPGHTDIVNNVWIDRPSGQARVMVKDPSTDTTIVTPTKQSLAGNGKPDVQVKKMGLWTSLRTGRFLSKNVETLYEAVHRTWPDAKTASLNDPSGRGANVATLELKGIPTILHHAPSIAKNIYEGWKHVSDPQMKHDPKYRMVSLQDDLGTSIGKALYNTKNPPKFAAFELEATDNRGHAAGPQSDQEIRAMKEADRNIGRILKTLDAHHLTKSTMFVVTADHGMEPDNSNPAVLGGVTAALEKSGVPSINAAPFIYLTDGKNVKTESQVATATSSRSSSGSSASSSASSSS